MPLKIVSPLSSIDEAADLIHAGADEFFCGYSPKAAITSNRREANRANISTLQELKDIAGLCKAHNIPLFVTCNKIFYTQEEFVSVLKLIDQVAQAGASGIIVSDLGLNHYLFTHDYNKFLRIHLSSVATVLNQKAVGFFKQFYFSRIILPRHLTLEEIASISRNHPGMEFEVFILNWNCVNIDGFCSTQHDLKCSGGDFPETWVSNQCCLPYEIQVVKREHGTGDSECRRALMKVRDVLSNVMQVSSTACGACSLRDLEQAGIHFVKVLDRLLSKEQKIKSVGFIRSCLDLCHEKDERQQHGAEMMEKFCETFGVSCNQNCYYEHAEPSKIHCF